ncbi:MAG: dual specificity protein phosphatase family protein [Thermoguttaceae bacterium]|jgi:protein tyrosine/serine phosphatase
MPERSRLGVLLGLLLATALSAAVWGGSDEAAAKLRPTNWAAKLDRPGLPNLFKIDAGLYRGAQPTAEGIKQLKKLGVKTIIDLRDKHSDKDILGDAKIAFEHIPMTTWNPKEADAVRFLQIVTDKARQPVFVHCQHGADRTGMMCAIYRVTVDGWSKQQAIDEMTKGGFGFHPIYTNLPKFIEKLDIKKIKAKAGLKK